jgi:hypothetical protein
MQIGAGRDLLLEYAIAGLVVAAAGRVYHRARFGDTLGGVGTLRVALIWPAAAAVMALDVLIRGCEAVLRVIKRSPAPTASAAAGRSRGAGSAEAPRAECKRCLTALPAVARYCPRCGFRRA